jgi:hypothetical protein
MMAITEIKGTEAIMAPKTELRLASSEITTITTALTTTLVM